jgi:hypothetical protein
MSLRHGKSEKKVFTQVEALGIKTTAPCQWRLLCYSNTVEQQNPGTGTSPHNKAGSGQMNLLVI